jgi:hypothetical protein
MKAHLRYRFRHPSPRILREFHCPEHGIHPWLLGTARVLSLNQFSDEQIFLRLYQLTRNVRRTVPEREINDAIAKVRGTRNLAHAGPSLKETPFDPELLSTVAAQLAGVDESYLVARSPIDPRTVTADGFLRAVFRPGEKVIVFIDELSQGQLLWSADSTWAQAKLISWASGQQLGVWYLTNPVDGLYHDNLRQGTRSRRSEESITSWRHMLLESDVAPLSQWLSYLCQIKARVVALYTSGHESVHAVLRMDGIASKQDWDAAVRRSGVVEMVCRYGACRGSLSAVRLSRLPGCRREETGGLQQLLFLNPVPESVSMSTLPILR